MKLSPIEYARKVAEMRRNQTLYLSGRNRSQTQLEKCKLLEAEVDHLTKQFLGDVPQDIAKSKFTQTSFF
jgi:chorismate mutase